VYERDGLCHAEGVEQGADDGELLEHNVRRQELLDGLVPRVTPVNVEHT
jgi:hypothetical protein